MAVGAAYRSKRTYGPVTAIWSCKIPLDCHQDACSQQAVNTNFVCYYRVSTTQQGQSGLGLDAQRQAVRDYAQKVQGTSLDEQVEVESGKRSDRPVLTNAIQRCRETGATLLVAKLDRLSRNLHFITTLQLSKVNFLAVDNRIRPVVTSSGFGLSGAVWARERRLDAAERAEAAPDGERDPGNT